MDAGFFRYAWPCCPYLHSIHTNSNWLNVTFKIEIRKVYIIVENMKISSYLGIG